MKILGYQTIGNHFGEDLCVLPKVHESPKSVGCVFMKLLQTVITLWHNLQINLLIYMSV